MKREDVEKSSICLSKGNCFGKPALYQSAGGRGACIVKDVQAKPFLFRWTLGLWLIQKEWKIYSRLAGVKGIPRATERIDRFAFAMEFLPGKPLERGKSIPSSFWPSLEGILKEIHARGVVHLDLRHKGNILISPEGQPFLIDFNSSFSFREGGFLRRFLFPFLRWIDYGGFLKLKERLSPGLMTREERSFLKRFSVLRKLWIFN